MLVILFCILKINRTVVNNEFIVKEYMCEKRAKGCFERLYQLGMSQFQYFCDVYNDTGVVQPKINRFFF